MPMVLGHEAAGEVVEVGAGVDGFAAGDHVVLAFVPACGVCEPCRAGRPPLCEPGRGGQRRGRAAVAASAAGATPAARSCTTTSASPRSRSTSWSPRARRCGSTPTLPFEIAALFGCAVLTGVGAVVNAADVRPGDRVAVFGLGGVGPRGAARARAAGGADDRRRGRGGGEARAGAGARRDRRGRGGGGDGRGGRATRPAAAPTRDRDGGQRARARRGLRRHPARRHHRHGRPPAPEPDAVDPRGQPGRRGAHAEGLLPRHLGAARSTSRASSRSTRAGSCRSSGCSPTASGSTSSTRASTASRAARPSARRSSSRALSPRQTSTSKCVTLRAWPSAERHPKVPAVRRRALKRRAVAVHARCCPTTTSS